MSEPYSLVLVAEDDEDDRHLLQIAADQISFPGRLRFVHDGAELADYLQRCKSTANAESAPPPDLILLDLNMPRKSGWEFLEDMSRGKFASIPVVVWTTSSEQEDRRKCMELGAQDFVTKPATMDGLIDSLKRILSVNSEQ